MHPAPASDPDVFVLNLTQHGSHSVHWTQQALTWPHLLAEFCTFIVPCGSQLLPGAQSPQPDTEEGHWPGGLYSALAGREKELGSGPQG